MIRIALCDDDSHFLQLLHEKVDQWFTERQIVSTCTDYFSARSLREALETSGFDIFFLDIEMPEIGGMELARQIRKAHPDSVIIFLTSHDEFAPDGYRVQALRYLSKQTWKEYLSEALSAAMEQQERQADGSLAVSHYGNIQRVPYRDILYIRHIARYCQIVTKAGKIIQDERGY